MERGCGAVAAVGERLKTRDQETHARIGTRLVEHPNFCGHYGGIGSREILAVFCPVARRRAWTRLDDNSCRDRRCQRCTSNGGGTPRRTRRRLSRDPELQMGEYSRRFDWEEEGRAWVDLFKGKTVSVHVDPNDSSKSVLRKDELEGHIAAYSNG